MGDSGPMPNGTTTENPEAMGDTKVAGPDSEIPTKEDTGLLDEQTEHHEAEKKPEAESQTGTDATTSNDLYSKLLERLETMEKKLQKYIGEEEEKTPEKDAENPEVEEEKVEEKEEEKEEVKEEEPFSVKKKIKYLPSETWYLRDCRLLWDIESSTHSLVVSMKSSAIGAVHLPFESSLVSPTVPEDSITSKEMDNDMANRVPDRIAISCSTLLNEIVKITGAKLETGANILVRPFKVLVPFQEEFAECLKEQEAICAKLIAEQGAKEKASSEPAADSEDGKKSGSESAKDVPQEKLSAEKQSKLRAAESIANGMKCLLHIINKDLQDIMEVRRQIKEGKLKDIAFEHLWHLFKPGDLVISTKPKDQAYRVLHIGGGRQSRDETDIDGKPVFKRGQKVTSDFVLDCFNIDFNGTHYGPAPKKISISEYDGVRPIAALDVIPIAFVPDRVASKIEDTLVTRGKKFVRLARVSHKKYKGLSVKEGNFRHEEVRRLASTEEGTLH
jgi:hypothetical protein